MPMVTALGAAFIPTSSSFHGLSPVCCIGFVPKLSQEQGKPRVPQAPSDPTAKDQLILVKLEVSLSSKSFSPHPPVSGRVSLLGG